MALPFILFSACSDNDSDEPQNPTVDKSKDWSITINLDGTNSKGLPYRFISATEFMLNYVTYAVVDGHINVIGTDEYEIGSSLGGNLTIFESITFMGTEYKVREIGERALKGNIIRLKLPSSISKIRYEALPVNKSFMELYFRSFTRPAISSQTITSPNLKIYVPRGATATYKELWLCNKYETVEYDL